MTKFTIASLLWAASAAAVTILAVPASAHEAQSDRSRFVDRCLAKLDVRDESVITECYTDDYVLSGGPETYFTPGRQLVGEQAV